MGKFLTFTGASGVGKTTLVKELLKDPQFLLVTSITTRNSRPSDLPEEYEYVTDAEFDWLKCWDAFVWNFPYCENQYGTKHESVNEAVRSSQTPVMILVPHAVKELRNYLQNKEAAIQSFYIRSPEPAVLRSRLEQRGEMQSTIEQRLEKNKGWDELAEKSGIPYVYITNNGTIEEAIEQVKKYL